MPIQYSCCWHTVWHCFVAAGTGSIVSRATINTHTVDIKHQCSLELVTGLAVRQSNSNSANSADEPWLGWLPMLLLTLTKHIPTTLTAHTHTHSVCTCWQKENKQKQNRCIPNMSIHTQWVWSCSLTPHVRCYYNTAEWFDGSEKWHTPNWMTSLITLKIKSDASKLVFNRFNCSLVRRQTKLWPCPTKAEFLFDIYDINFRPRRTYPKYKFWLTVKFGIRFRKSTA